MTDNIVALGAYTLRHDGTLHSETVVEAKKKGRGYFVVFADGSRMPLKKFKKCATKIPFESTPVVVSSPLPCGSDPNSVYGERYFVDWVDATPVEPTNGIDDAL